MNRLVLILSEIIIFLSIPIYCTAQWSDTTTFDSYNLTCIKFKDNVNGFVFGSGGIVLKTNNCGKTWNDISIKTKINFSDFQFIADTLIYAYSYNYSSISYLLKSSINNINWNELDTIPASCYKIYFVNDSIGFYGTDESIYKTGNGGKNWKKVWNTPTGTTSIFEILFINDTIGVACGAKYKANEGIFGTILRTTNAGESWYEVFNNSPYSSEVEKLKFLKENNIFLASLKNNSFLVSNDSGKQWNESGISYESNECYMIKSFLFLNLDTGYLLLSKDGCAMVTSDIKNEITNKCKIVRTIDRGISWTNQSIECLSSYANPFIAVDFINDSIGFVVGYDKIFKTTNAGGDIDLKDTVRIYYSINDNSLEPFVQIYPSLINQKLHIENKSAHSVEYLIYNQNGILISKGLTKSNEIKLVDFSASSNGIYFIKVIGADGILSKKLIKTSSR